MMNSAIARVVLAGSLALCIGHSARSADDVWPGFRGTGDGRSRAENLPLAWQPRGRSAGSWSIRLPGYGQSSPVVWKDRVFVTSVSGEEKEHLHLLAVSLDDGRSLWRKDFAGTQRVKDSDTVSRGAPTPVVDAERVYAVFESGDVFALTHAGAMVWQRSFVGDYGELQGPHGYASSPVLVDGLLIVQVSHSGPSYILALDARTGENRWKVDHPSQTGWSSPAVFRHGGQRGVIVSTSGSVRALAAQDGRELWHVNNIQGNSTASPTINGDLVIIGVGADRSRMRGSRSAGRSGRTDGGQRPAADASTPNAERSDEEEQGTATSSRPSRSGSLAIKLGGTGDVTETHVVWTASGVTTGYASPIVLDGRAYFVNRIGVVQCVELATGKTSWQNRLPGQVWASPVATAGHAVFFCKDGTVVALKSGPEFIEAAESQLSATDIVYGVAAVDNSWIVRTGRGLVRINGVPSVPESPAGNESR